jgi:lipoprotein-releasing system ATP-binding protein
MLKAINICKSYGKLKILDNVSIEVGSNKLVCLVGPSGAGKTTFLQILGTLDKADSGEIWIDGERVDQYSQEKLAALRNVKLGFVFQFHMLLPEFTALENVAIPAMIGGKSKKEALKKSQEILEFMGLQDRLHHKPSELSGGEQQRTALARALINNPPIILADEPTGNLDEENAGKIHEYFVRLKNEWNKTIVIVTHNPQLAHLADEVIHIKHGKIFS